MIFIYLYSLTPININISNILYYEGDSMSKPFIAKVRQLSENAKGITIPQEIVEEDRIQAGKRYWVELRGEVKL